MAEWPVPFKGYIIPCHFINTLFNKEYSILDIELFLFLIASQFFFLKKGKLLESPVCDKVCKI